MKPSAGKETINNAKITGLSLQVKKSYGLLIHNPNIRHTTYLKDFRQKVSWNIFSPQKCSLTLETALAYPIFLFAVLQLLSIFLMYRKDTEEMMKLMQSAKIASSYIDTAEDIISEVTGANTELSIECIDLFHCYDASPLVTLTGGQLTCIVRARVRKFDGYNNAQSDNPEKCVYVTENCEVYHTDIHCTHLEISIQETTKEEVTSMHNSKGESYEPCAFCTQSIQGTNCYITEEGNHYHYELTCSGLTRKIRMITYQEAEGLPACSRCGGEE